LTLRLGVEKNSWWVEPPNPPAIQTLLEISNFRELKKDLPKITYI